MPNLWSAYEYQPSFVLGFHGCEKEVGDAILRGEYPHLRFSEKPTTGWAVGSIFGKETLLEP